MQSFNDYTNNPLADAARAILSGQNLQESFGRLPGHVINNELYTLNKSWQTFYNGQKNGSDADPKVIAALIKGLTSIKSEVKMFSSSDSVPVSYVYKEAAEQDPGEYDAEGSMAKNALRTIIRNAKGLHDMLTDDENLPEHVQANLVKAEEAIVSARDYIESEKELAQRNDKTLPEQLLNNKKYSIVFHTDEDFKFVKKLNPSVLNYTSSDEKGIELFWGSKGKRDNAIQTLKKKYNISVDWFDFV